MDLGSSEFIDEDQSEEMMENTANSDIKQGLFVDQLSIFKILLEKSQIPSVKQEKSIAAKGFINKYAALTGDDLTEKALYKKISNMKTAVKTKSDRNITGNKKIILSKWEKKLLDLLGSESNPVFSRIPGGIKGNQSGSSNVVNPCLAVSVIEQSYPAGLNLTELPGTSTSTTSTKPSIQFKKRKMSAMEEAETEETKDLTTTQLQRLVLIKQLELINLKIKKIND